MALRLCGCRVVVPHPRYARPPIRLIPLVHLLSERSEMTAPRYGVLGVLALLVCASRYLTSP